MQCPTIPNWRSRTSGRTSFRRVFPELAESIRRSRGRPPVNSPKEAVTLRLDPQTLARFKATGKNWRAKMSGVLDKAKIG